MANECGRGERDCVHADAVDIGDYPRLGEETRRFVDPLRKRVAVQHGDVLDRRREQCVHRVCVSAGARLDTASCSARVSA